MAKLYFDAITSEHAYNSYIQSDSSNNLSLSLSCLQTRASNWGREQLFICRVIISPTQRALLPAYKNEHIAIDHNISDEAKRQIDNFLHGPDPELVGQSEHYLAHKYGVALGQVWAALAAVKKRRLSLTNADVSQGAVPTSNKGTPESKRVRRNTNYKEFVHSGTCQISSSSPTSKLPGSTPDSSVGYVDQVPTEDLPLEDNTVRLISCVMRHILYYTQLPGLTPVVEFRDIRQRLGLEIPDLGGHIVAVDDGGLCLRIEEEKDRFVVVRNMVALLEAKRSLKVVEGKPGISDECLAQMTCEAILARATDPLDEFQDESVTIINATQNYICFLQFDVENEYIDELRFGVTPSQPLMVTATQWFDLSTKTGRECVLKNICGLMALAKEQFALEIDGVAE
ncbi:hypothetical protein H9Q69_012774 [Fusarium xylarioides]|nr:hypothetical protein H9Q69_012774 [Fusarium xylarioides]